MNNYSKALLGTAAAGAMAMGAFATPAHAQPGDRNNIDAGDVIAGAVIVGGIAALLGAFDDDDDRYRDRRYDRRHADPRRAVDQCVRIAENEARRAGYRHADVYEIYDVDRHRRGWRISGRIAVEGQRGYRGYRGDRYDRRDYRDYDDRYDRYDRYDRRDRYRSGDEGRFTCKVEYGRVRDLDFKGVRGLR